MPVTLPLYIFTVKFWQSQLSNFCHKCNKTHLQKRINHTAIIKPTSTYLNMIEHTECHWKLFRTLRFRMWGLHGDADACCRDAGEGKQVHAVTMGCLLRVCAEWSLVSLKGINVSFFSIFCDMMLYGLQHINDPHCFFMYNCFSIHLYQILQLIVQWWMPIIMEQIHLRCFEVKLKHISYFQSVLMLNFHLLDKNPYYATEYVTTDLKLLMLCYCFSFMPYYVTQTLLWFNYACVIITKSAWQKTHREHRSDLHYPRIHLHTPQSKRERITWPECLKNIYCSLIS